MLRSLEIFWLKNQAPITAIGTLPRFPGNNPFQAEGKKAISYIDNNPSSFIVLLIPKPHLPPLVRSSLDQAMLLWYLLYLQFLARRSHLSLAAAAIATIGAACGCQFYSFIELTQKTCGTTPKSRRNGLELPSSSPSFLSPACPTSRSWSLLLRQVLNFQSIYLFSCFLLYLSFGPLVLNILWSFVFWYELLVSILSLGLNLMNSNIYTHISRLPNFISVVFDMPSLVVSFQ
jgi:hypothetical protein